MSLRYEYSSGDVCLSIIGDSYTPSISVRQILQGIQDLLNTPNERSPANTSASHLMVHNPKAYSKKIKEQALLFAESDE